MPEAELKEAWDLVAHGIFGCHFTELDGEEQECIRFTLDLLTANGWRHVG